MDDANKDDWITNECGRGTNVLLRTPEYYTSASYEVAMEFLEKGLKAGELAIWITDDPKEELIRKPIRELQESYNQFSCITTDKNVIKELKEITSQSGKPYRIVFSDSYKINGSKTDESIPLEKLAGKIDENLIEELTQKVKEDNAIGIYTLDDKFPFDWIGIYMNHIWEFEQPKRSGTRILYH